MNIIPKFQTKYGENLGVELFVNLPDILQNPTTYFADNDPSGTTAIRVSNGDIFSLNQYIVLGSFSAQNAEIALTDDTTPPTSDTITLATATLYEHSRGERVLFIPYNKIEIQKSDDDGATWAVLDTIDIKFNNGTTYYNDTAGIDTDLYRVRFYSEKDNEYSQESDELPGTGYPENTVGAIILKALGDMGFGIDDTMLTQKFLVDALDSGRDDIAYHKNIEKMSFRGVFNAIIGRVIAGRNYAALPSNLKDPATSKNILHIKIGRDKYPMKQTDKTGIDRWYMGTGMATIAEVVADSDTEITLSSTGDLPQSGTLAIEAGDATKTISYIQYTAKDDLTNKISGVTGIETGGYAVGKQVWVYASFGMPIEYAIVNSEIYFSQPFDNSSKGMNIYADYYKSKVKAKSFGDQLDEPFYHIYVPYIRYRIKLRINPQLQREQDDDFKAWIEGREAQVQKETLGQDIRLRVDVPGRNSLPGRG